MPWPRPGLFTAFLEDVETASSRLAAARRPRGRRISGRSGSGEAAEITSTTATSDFIVE